MSRNKRVNSGWMFGGGVLSHQDELEPLVVNTIETLVDGVDIRTGIPDGLALERAGYFFERLIIWGRVVLVTGATLTEDTSTAHLRLGTLSTDAEPDEIGLELFSAENAENWGRILQDEVLTCYRSPTYDKEGSALVVSDTPTATSRQAYWQYKWPSTFLFDVRQRFSLQREEDKLVMAFGGTTANFNATRVIGGEYHWKALVKEYRD